MMFKTTVLFFAATALVAVSAAPTSPAPAFDSFPKYKTTDFTTAQQQLIELFNKQTTAPQPAAPKPPATKPGTTPPKGKRDANSAIVSNIQKYALYARAAYQINSNHNNPLEIMMFKTTVLFFAATALVAVSAAPTSPAPAFDSFPKYKTTDFTTAQQQLIELFNEQTTAPQPAAPKPPATKPGTTPPKGKRDANSAIVSNIQKYALYARAAYQINSNQWNCPKCTTDARMAGYAVSSHFTNSNGLSYGYVAHNEQSGEIIVAFRGTTTPTDMVTDLKLLQADWEWAETGSGAKVHSGFKTAVLSVAEPIDHAITALRTQNPNRNIVFVGHSLGGAQASLAAARFVKMNPGLMNSVSLYTYGQPRTGNSAFAQWMHAHAFPKYRVTYGSDPVPRLPAGADYTHHTQEIYYTAGNQIKFCSTSNGEDPDCMRKLAITNISLKDHSEYPGLEIV
ncbi:alpha/beta-hydrolase [Martensiomyces pterosporus]|nr:alpha/beta-hydrolase [Martensiomyces pterosporus]